MVYTIYTLKLTRYLHGNFLYRVHGRWRKCFPVTAELRKQLNSAVVEAYSAAKEQERPSVKEQMQEAAKTAEKAAPKKAPAEKAPKAAKKER